MPQLNVRIPTQPELDYINDVLNDVADKFPNEITNKHLALKKICYTFQKGIDALEFKEIPLNIQGTIDAVRCDYIRWDGMVKSFICFESFHKNRKTHPIGNEHDKVIIACTLCKKGKSDAIRYRVEEGFRKKGINSMFNLTKLLIRMDVEGAVAQIFLCQAKQFTDDELIISPDCVHMKCPNLDNQLVLIEEYCVTQTDPHTMNPPCKWLIAPFLRVPIKPSPEAKAVMDEIAQLEHDKENEMKEVDAVVIDVEPNETAVHEALKNMTCPKCGSELEEDAEDSSELYCEKCNYGWRYKRKQPEPIEEVDSEPIEEVEPNLSEEEQTKLTELEQTQEGEKDNDIEPEPQNPRDIIAKEKEEKEKKKSTKKKGDK